MRFLPATLLVLLAGCGLSTRTAPDDLLRIASGDADRIPGGNLSITFFETGIGDAFLLELPSGKTLLVDAGIGWHAGQILDYLRARGIARLDGLLLTHAHIDHYGGMERIVRELPVGVFYSSGVPGSGGYHRLWKALEERGVAVRVLRRGDCLEELCRPAVPGGGLVTAAGSPALSLETLYPDSRAVEAGGGLNRTSLALRLTHGSLRFLLLGDCEWPEESRLLALEGVDLKADVLKLGHHGSPRSGGADFLAAVAPQVAIAQGTSLINVPLFYPRPNYRIRKVLSEAGTRVFTDGRDGVIQVVSDGRAISVRTARSGLAAVITPSGRTAAEPTADLALAGTASRS
jgi:competence protein ComEC